MKKIFVLLFLGLGLTLQLVAQDSTTENQALPAKKVKYTKATFQSPSLINFQDVETQPKGNLQFMVAHHFSVMWDKNSDAGQNFAQFLGLNSGIAQTYISLDYSITDYANVGFALAGNAQFEGWAKFRLLRQQTGLRNIPVSVTWVALANANALKNPLDKAKSKLAWNKFSFMNQLLIGRKFSNKFSMQLMATMIHFNIVPYGVNNSNNIFSLGLGGKYQLGENKALTFEYGRQLNMYDNVIDANGNILNYSPDLAAIGIEFNTGGHVFQFYIGNVTAGSNITQLSKNTNFIKDGQFALGFRLNRAFFIEGK